MPVNPTDEPLLRLAELPNIFGVKESSGSIAQSFDLSPPGQRAFRF